MPQNIKLIALMLLAGISTIDAQEPKINFIEPAAVMPGRTTRLKLSGENVDTNCTLWTSFPCEISGDMLTLPADAPVGIGAVRAINARGVSGFHLLMIDDLPSVKESSSNQTIAAAQEITPPIAIDGACNEVAFDYYAFRARKGQEFTIEAVAQRLGSQADTVVRVLDEKGREHVFCDDGPGVGRDSRCTFKAPASARYFLEVRDINYQGGRQYRYRLRIGSFPLLTVPYPPVVPVGEKTEVSLGAKTFKVFPSEEDMRIPLSVRGKSGSGFAALLTSELDEALELEPNESIEDASSVRQSVCGRFDKPKDRDLFRFEAKQDERLVIAARTRSLGSACDVMLNVLKADGSKLLEANVTGADEGTITNTFKEAGIYYAELQELTESASPDFVYRLTILPLMPGFELATEQDKWQPGKDGHYTLKVTCVRRQYDGPITVSIANAEHLTLDDNIIAEKKNETTLKLKPSSAFARDKLVHLQLNGQAKVGDIAVTFPLSTRPALRKQFPKLPSIPAELDGLVALFVAEKNTD